MRDDTVAPLGDLTCREAGRRGGRATSATHDHAHYQRIGAAGAAVRLARSTPAERSATARAGGEATRAFWGREHFREIGRRGGESTRDHHGTASDGAIARRRTTGARR